MNEHFKKKDLNGYKRKDESKRQYIRHAKDLHAFLDECRVIFDVNERKNKQTGLLDFDRDVLKHFHENQYSIMVKSRQMHTTTLAACYCAWNLIFKYDFHILSISNSGMCATRFLEKVRTILENYSNEFFHWEEEVQVNNSKKIHLKNGSSIHVSGASPSAGRGQSPSLIIFDEAAFIKDIDMIWMGVGMSLMGNGKCIMYSTPNGTDNFFHKVFKEASEGKNNFAAKRLHWSENPNINQERYKSICNALGNDQRKIDQEMECKFLEQSDKINVSKRINFRIESEVYDKIIKKIDETGVSLSSYVKDLIKKDLDLK